MTITKVLLFVAVCFAMSINYSSARDTEGVTELCREGNYNTHGRGTNIDPRCCVHECNKIIGPGETKYGLTNPSNHIRRHCGCDAVVYECLTYRNNGAQVLIDNVCFYPKNCPPGGLCIVDDYEWVTQSVAIPTGYRDV